MTDTKVRIVAGDPITATKDSIDVRVYQNGKLADVDVSDIDSEFVEVDISIRVETTALEKFLDDLDR